MTVSRTSELESKKPKIAKKLTKRQKRKLGPNPANTWQQQPKLKSTSSRNKAYLHNAGLGSKKAPATKIDPDLDVINSPEYKFGRLLASPSARTRHATVKRLEAWLKARTDTKIEDGGLSSLDLLKLWKGLWHTLYLCDGVVVQEEVSSLMVGLIWAVGGTLEEDEYAGRFYLDLEDSEFDEEKMEEQNDNDAREEQEGDVMEDTMEIIEMEESDGDDDDDNNEADDENEDDINPISDENQKHCRGAHLSALFVRTYFQTLSREWSNMDKYRIDKFYTLTRLFMREIYRYMASRHWNLGIIRLFNDALFEEVLRVSKYGNGIRFHVLDICLEELAKVNMDVRDGPGLPLTEAIFMDCLEPFFAMAQRVQDTIVHERVLEKVILRFLNEYSVVSDNFEVESTSDENEQSNLVMDQVHVGTVAKFLFEIASDPNTLDRNRSQLYEMHKTYMRRIKTVGRDVSLDEEEDKLDQNEELIEEEPVEDSSAKVQEVIEKGVLEKSHESEKKVSKKSKKRKKADKLLKEKSKDENQDNIKKAERKKKGKEQNNESKAEDELQSNLGMKASKQSKDVGNAGKVDNSSKKKKKKQKKQMKQQNEVDENGDEVITISMEDQKIAAAAVAKAMAIVKEKKNKKRNHISNSDSEKSCDDSKKVKFTDSNKAKSYKASMKDLKNLDAKATLEKTPDRGILHASKRGERRASLFASEGKSKRKKKKSSRNSL